MCIRDSFIDCFEKFAKWRLHVFTRPGELLAIPELRTRLFAIAIYILSEECHFFCTILYDVSDFSDYLSLWTTHLSSSRMRYDTKSTEVITPSLDDDIRAGRIFLELLYGEVLVLSLIHI